MRVPNSHRAREVRADQAMTPMIDVVFLLLIFFVCASVGHLKESLMTLDLARGDVTSSTVVQPPPEAQPDWVEDLWLKLSPGPAGTQIDMNGQTFSTIDQLTPALNAYAKFSPESPIILDIHPEVPAGDLIRVDDACRAAGFESIDYAADPDRVNPRQ